MGPRRWALVVLLSAWPVAAATTVPAPEPAPSGAPQTLWYKHPITEWDEALPLGNGRLGAMVFGGVQRERIALNEDSLWMGGPKDTTNPQAKAALPELRKLLFAGQPVEAYRLAEKTMLGIPHRLQSYQPLGDLRLGFDRPGGEVQDYQLELDLDTAIARVRYVQDGVRVTRETFVSAPDQVVVVRITVDKPGALSMWAWLDRPQDAATTVLGDDRIDLSGRLDCERGLSFLASVKVLAEGGTRDVFPERLAVDNANAVTLILAGATSFKGIASRYAGEDPRVAVDRALAAAAAKPYEQLRADHIADHQSFFRRVGLRLGADDAKDPARDLPTDERLERVKKGGKDSGLDALYFQLGRYLLIASSRPGDLPANLQGIWNESLKAPWNSDYHLNINIQMNYWPAEVTNLAEMHQPLFDYLESLRESGRRTARVHYGARGFVAHHISDIFGFTTPGDHPRAGLWPTGAAWMAQHLWEHYQFGRDKAFLARAYPVMKESAEFFLDYLVEDPQGRLVSGPSVSPENRYRLPNGNVGYLSMGPSMDHQIIRGLFEECIRASEILGVDGGFRKELEKARLRIPASAIGRHGQIQEWAEDYEEPDPGHRHISQLFGLHPSDQITMRGTPDLAKAARATIERRLANGGGHTGWSRAWIINFWARLEDGEKAYENVQALLAKSTLPNLWDLHPPFQIDGNFGGTAGIAEMLVQSHAGEIALLPALPAAWPDGAFRGLRARGAIEVDVTWAGGRATSATLRVASGDTQRIRPPRGQKIEAIALAGKRLPYRPDGDVAVVSLSAGKSYDVTFR
jgi:alpha-L-fucosidase 2